MVISAQIDIPDVTMTKPQQDPVVRAWVIYITGHYQDQVFMLVQQAPFSSDIFPAERPVFFTSTSFPPYSIVQAVNVNMQICS